jgi:glycosyltransferase involved in cell wall biosynthesis
MILHIVRAINDVVGEHGVMYLFFFAWIAQIRLLLVKIIHCFRSPVGGLFRHVTDLAQLQAEQGIQVGILCDSLTGGDRADQVLSNLNEYCALGIHRLPIGRRPRLNDLRSLRSAKEICRQIEPDIVHGHGAKGGAYSRLLTRNLPAKNVYTPHGGALHYHATSAAGTIYFALERFLQKNTDAIVFESQFSFLAYEKKVGPITCAYKIIHNGLADAEIAVRSHLSDGSTDFLFLGELRGFKGVDVFLSAIERARKERPFKVMVAGAGEDSEDLLRRIERLDLGGTITLSPPIYPATEAFKTTKCVVVPSRAESLPYIVLEAAGAGVPVIATKVGGIGEIFGPYAEELIEPDNDVALANAMLAIMGSPASAETAAKLLKERISSSFRLDKMGRDINALYRDLLQPALA